MQRNAMNDIPTFPYQSVGQLSHLNGNPVQNTSNYPWQSEITAGGTSWKQYGYPLALQTHSNGLMVSPEQGRSMHLMGLIPPQSSQSLYGVPVSNTEDSNLLLQTNMDQFGSFHLPAPSGSSSGNPYAPPASGSESKTSFDHASSQGVENAIQSGGYNPAQKIEVLMSDGGGKGFSDGSDVFLEKSSQAPVGLDPTEEKILFGSDDNLWDAFGGLSVTENNGADLLNGFPSMQNGTWSALMQSAVGETSFSDSGNQEEVYGSESKCSRSQSENQAFPISSDYKNPPQSIGVIANDATLITHYSHSSRVPVDCKSQDLPTGEVNVNVSSNLSQMEKGRLSGFNVGAKMLHGGWSSSVHPSYLPSTSAPFARSAESFSPSHISPSGNMLELVHKVDLSKDQNAVFYSDSTNYNQTSVIPAGGSFGHCQSQTSSYQGFNLQLVSPSQGIALSDLNYPAQCISSLDRPPQFDSENDRSGGLDDSSPNLKDSRSVSLASSSTYLRNLFQNQYTTTSGGQRMGDPQSSIVDGHAYCDQQSTNVTGNIASRAQLTGISPQMAPSLFGQYEAFGNEQLLPVHNLPRIPMVKNVEQLVKPRDDMVVQSLLQVENVVTDTCQFANTSPITRMSMRPKKRKSATSDLIPWNKEIGHAFKRIQSISLAEVDWAQSSKRLVERVADKTDSHEDMSLFVGPRRRLILTTKLMQQVFCPPPASLLSLDGRSNCEALVYSIARIALGDVCNLVGDLESDLSPDNRNSFSGKRKSSERIRDQYISKVMEDFMNRAKELENELSRLDQFVSLLDVRLDCQNLERFSIINRFAKFHGRSKVEKAETSSTSNANEISLKCPQTYVTSHPMPRSVPERVQCLTIN